MKKRREGKIKAIANGGTADRQPQRSKISKSKRSIDNSVTGLQKNLGNQAVLEMIKSGSIQAKLKVSQPGDKYEQEADTIAEKIARTSESNAESHSKEVGKSGDSHIWRKAISSKNKESTSHRSPITNSMKSSGRPLTKAERNHFEPRFGENFSNVRVHTDSNAAEFAAGINARAFTVGSKIVFGEGQYNPQTESGKKLIAHELSHVLQQSRNDVGNSQIPLIQREVSGDITGITEQDARDLTDGGLWKEVEFVREQLMVLSPGSVTYEVALLNLEILEEEVRRREKLIIDYEQAKKSNRYYGNRNVLGWETKLEEVAGGAYSRWGDLWKEGKYDEFADAVAAFQSNLGWSKDDVDGVLGLKTWSQIAGLGEAIAGIEKVKWEESERLCTKASEELIKRGHEIAYGRALTLSEGKTMNVFNIILNSRPDKMLDIESKYRGTGAAGALVYAGLGDFVTEEDIWAGKLKPGAVIQVWEEEFEFDLLREGQLEEEGETRPLRESDSSFSGTSFVFVRYDTETSERILIRHKGENEWRSKGSYDVWVAANVK